jgi:hypothetical protein
MILLAFLGRVALGADSQVPDFRIRWLLHQESGGIEQLEQWNLACNQSKCSIGRWISGKDFGQKSVPVTQARDLLSSAEKLPSINVARAPQAASPSHHEERIWVDQTEKSWTKVRPGLADGDDIASGLAWARFELDLRHAWEGQDR